MRRRPPGAVDATVPGEFYIVLPFQAGLKYAWSALSQMLAQRISFASSDFLL